MAKRGRPPVLDETRRREILAIVSVGCSRRTAARYVGCAPSTIHNTAERDPQFAAQLENAESKPELTQLKNITAAAKKPQYWRAAAWVLERLNPRRYAPRGPETITRDQIARLLDGFARIVADEVPVDRFRKRIIKRLDRLAAGFDCSLSPHSEAPDDDCQ